MKTLRLIAIIGACFLALNSGNLKASDLVTYQGKLTDAAAAPLPDGQYWLGARIWDTASGGTIPLWSRKYQVPVTGGLFSLMLGATGSPWETPPPLTASLKLALAGTSRFVEITVMSNAGQAEKPAGEWQILAPRQSLSSVPYAMNGVPPGTVVPFAGTVIPDGWLLCEGTTFYDGADPRYASLFAAIGTTYGLGAGSQFKLPDLRGRVALGSGQGAGLTNRVVASAPGAEMTTLSPANLPPHQHQITGNTNNDGAHSHSTDINISTTTGSLRNAYVVGSGVWSSPPSLGISGGSHSHAINFPSQSNSSPATMSATPFSVVQPSLVLNYIIKL